MHVSELSPRPESVRAPRRWWAEARRLAGLTYRQALALGDSLANRGCTEVDVETDRAGLFAVRFVCPGAAER
jgi:hypothetical protein